LSYYDWHIADCQAAAGPWRYEWVEPHGSFSVAAAFTLVAVSRADIQSADPGDTRHTFPGDELVQSGLADIAAGRRSVEALLVAAAGMRLRRAGVQVPEHRFDRSGRELYALLEAELGVGAHSRYNALQRRVVAYCAARTQDARRRG
jgi:hypothetical protein